MAENVATDIVEAFNRERDLLEKFRTELQAAIGHLSSANAGAKIVFFIDELDRCRPTFAIELLERVKHLFNVQGLVFVLSVDKQQLEASTASVYGVGINAQEYLRRFIDLEYGIPRTNSEQFTKHLINRFNLEVFFKERVDGELRRDRDDFIKFFTLISDALDLSLRAKERCITRLRTVLDQTPGNHYLDPILVALLIIFRSNQKERFEKIISGESSAEETMSFLMALPKFSEQQNEHPIVVIHTYLLAADPDRKRSTDFYKKINKELENQSLDEARKNYISELIRMKGYIPGPMRNGVRLAPIAAKIDLAARMGA